MTLRVVLADDEPLVRERLRALVGSRPDCTLVAECADGAEAVGVIERERPDVALLDVQMPEMDGFEVLEALPEDRRPAVIFVTAYDEYAVRAFEVNAVDYLLKPLEASRFNAAIDRVAKRREAPDPPADPGLQALLDELRRKRGHATRLVVRDGHRVSFVAVAEIDWIDASGNYARIHAGGRSQLLRETLKSLEGRLDPERFVRVHRSAIVNIERIVAMEPYFHGEYVLTLRDGTKVTSSRTCSGRLREMLK
ncbi:MAG TPA: LytTR family DNA-binding domain-containing protein [Gemmatimonadales bacterium]|nr:LytTR family DNA-binding domain-containing protein [Gemmatimonadales bacterium]